MYHFEYVPKSETKPVKNKIIDLISLVQGDIRSYFSFQFRFIGSEARNMVTHDIKSNVGYDFDVNIMVNDENEDYSADEIKHILMNAFNAHAKKYNYDFCEDSTRVFTIKVKDRENSKILHSCDFAIVFNCDDGKQQYIRFNKPDRYEWVFQSDGFYVLPEKIVFCKENNLWQNVRKLYLDKKNKNKESTKKSRTIFAETVHQICQQNGYYE